MKDIQKRPIQSDRTMGQSPQFEFEDPGSERTESLNESMELAIGDPANETPDAVIASGGEFQASDHANRTGITSSIADDDLVATISDELMMRKQELYRRLAR